MSTTPTFSGFPQKGLQFFRDLAENNNRDWFEAHKQQYLDWMVAPAQSFVLTLGPMLQTILSDIVYDARTNGSGSIRRIYRDIRFSKDKAPYHTALGMSFWQSGQKRNQGSGFYVHLDATGAQVYTGMYMFDKQFLEAYRQAVVDEELGAELEDAIASLKRSGDYPVGGESFKRVPAGYDSKHPRADLLRHGTLHASSPHIDPQVVSTPEFVDVCLNHCRNMAPLHQWLVRVGERLPPA
jgi:uncharacterized protein (TIGR02453 family)